MSPEIHRENAPVGQDTLGQRGEPLPVPRHAVQADDGVAAVGAVSMDVQASHDGSVVARRAIGSGRMPRVADETQYLGAGGRLRGGPAPELVAAAYEHEIRHAERLAVGLSLADLAHAVSLVESGVLGGDRARPFLRGLLELHAIPSTSFPWKPELGDAFNSREAALRDLVGPDAAGWLSAGRPRREAFRVGLRMTAAEQTLELVGILGRTAAAFGSLGRRHVEDTAADYTYLQPAMPTTAGHLMLAYAYPLLRDAARLAGLHDELQQSVAGVGGSAGSRWPIDRQRLAGLLGASGLIVHTKDAAWQTDVFVELLAAVAISLGHLSQVGQDLEIYASREFGLVELADAHSRASALMPQKKNPYALAAIRAQAAQAAGDVAAALTVLHTGSARTDHFHLLNGIVPRALEEAAAHAFLAQRVIEDLTLDPDRMARVAREGFTVAADLADVLALEGGVDHRTAHRVVGLAVRRIVEGGGTPSDLDVDALTAAAETITGSASPVSRTTLESALDPAACAQDRPQVGSSSAARMQEMLEDVETQVADIGAWMEAMRQQTMTWRAALVARAEELAG